MTRRGAFAAYLDIDHPDFEEFLQIRDIGNPIQNLFTGACIPDYWMQEMVDGDMEKRKLWAKVLESRQQKGMPYLFFTDNVNKNKPQVYKDKKMQITHSNLCVAPYTKILTYKGYRVIGELEDQEVEVWNGEEWSKTTVKKTGSDQELVRVKLSSGQEIDCTPYHKFYVQVGIPGRGGKIVEKRAQELEEGDKLIKFDLPVIEGEEILEHAYDNGFFSGDGCMDGPRSKIYLYNQKRDLQKFFSSVDNWVSQANLNRDYGYGKDLKVKYFVPGANYTIESRLKWLAGLLDAYGTSLKSVEGSCSLQIASINQQFLRDLQLMLQTLGCHSKITLNREAGRFMMPKNDGTGELKEYDCNPVWRIVISCGALTKLTNMGLKCNRVTWNILKEPNRGALRFVKVESKPEKIEGLHDTYCFTEPKRHMGMFNGALIGQCSEISLTDSESESFVCCLSSLNLELYDEWKNTDTVKLAIYFLDAVMSEFIENSAGIPGLEAVNKFARRHRALGLGVMGYHSYLQKNNIPFESMEAKTFNAKVFKEIESKARKASKELAKVYGEPELLKGYGLRNTTLMAIAPTTSSSAILGQTSPGVEPFASNYYKAGLAKGNFMRKNKYLEAKLEELGKNTEEVWRDIMLNRGSVQHLDFLDDHTKAVFRTFKEISQREIITQAVQRQRYIDQAQSINLNIPPDIPLKDVNALYIYAWQSGLKTLYYQRSESVAKNMAMNFNNCTSCEA